MQNTNSHDATTTRVAYIRTIIDKNDIDNYYESTWINLRVWLSFWVGQAIPLDPWDRTNRQRTSPPPRLRHHYILGHSNSVDSFILEWLIEVSKSDSQRLSRDDFEIFLPQSQIKDPANKQLLDRLRKERVKVTTVTLSTSSDYGTDDICDGVMLSRSDYILEASLIRGANSWMGLDAFYRDSLRHNHPQQYNTKELADFYFDNRLKDKMGGHTKKDCSYPHAKSEEWKRDHEIAWKNYKCPSCGKRCKRSKGCKTTGEQWASRAKTAWAEDVDTTAPRPPEFERDWRSLSVEDVINYHGQDVASYKRFRNWEWRSVHTFSGE
ncbi:hypothetical protein FHETE_889 [Fusarium heterosporum]|uniref:Uncharacterized protein n=1 Tax=Fusarium heterosporum TaxID=42747 RepID=A0A8H5TYK3_FUSHE|nr:hypothetical protein FHETE_889 [Fusarium heterosporum]